MKKNKRVKVLMAACFIVIAGILYTCSMLVQSKDETFVLEHGLSEDGTVLTSQMEETSNDKIKNNKKEVQNLEGSKTVEPTFDSIDQPRKLIDSEVVAKKKIFVHLCGEIFQPGVYEVEDGTRLVEVIKMASGMTKKAAKDYINLAQKVVDGQQVYIPTIEEVSQVTKVEVLNQTANIEDGEKKTEVLLGKEHLVDINTATKEELMTLSGIGNAKAEKIITYREINGAFDKIEDIMKIDGIKEGLFRKICGQITVK